MKQRREKRRRIEKNEVAEKYGSKEEGRKHQKEEEDRDGRKEGRVGRKRNTNKKRKVEKKARMKEVVEKEREEDMKDGGGKRWRKGEKIPPQIWPWRGRHIWSPLRLASTRLVT